MRTEKRSRFSSALFSLSAVLQVVEANKDSRAKAAAEASALLHQEQLAFEAWRDSLETVPTIKVGSCCRVSVGNPARLTTRMNAFLGGQSGIL